MQRRRGAQRVSVGGPAPDEHADVFELDRIAARRHFEEAESLRRADDALGATGLDAT